MYNRKALGAEDVEFTMPLKKEDPDEGGEGGGGNGDMEKNKTEEGDCDIEKEKEKAVLRGGADDILESLGIEADSLPGISILWALQIKVSIIYYIIINFWNIANSNKFPLQFKISLITFLFLYDLLPFLNSGFATSTTALKNTAQSKVVLDGRSDSLVFIEGVECQSLLNYLLNAKLSQGPNELPPTILAPVAFPGATMKSLKIKEHTIGGRAGHPKAFQIDVTGQ